MSLRESIVSLLIAFHLVAITLAAVPRPVANLPPGTRGDHDPVAAVLYAPLTTLAGWLGAVQGGVLKATESVRPITRRYVAAGLPQNWSMFSSVLTMQRYVRIDYHVVTSPGSRPLAFRELVLPSQVEGVPRLSYRSADKAVRVILGWYLTHLRDEESELAALDNDRPQASRLAPMVRHFLRQFSARHDIPRDQITRLEVWTGTVPIPPPGTARSFPIQLRTAVLARYRTMAPSPASWTSPALWSVQEEAGISWQLVHIEGLP